MANYADMGQFLMESFNMSNERKPRTVIKKSKKLNESKSLKESVTIPDKLDELLEYTDFDYEALFNNLVKWLPFEDLEKFANDLARDWDLDIED